jgi:hypothetical protein
MPRKGSKISRGTSRIVDDLKVIHGIGALIENQLHNAGIHTFKQFAALSPEAIAAQVPNLSVNHIKKQDWIGQAHKLLYSKAKSTRKKETPIRRQHYENFTLEFLLNEKNKIQRMRMVHVQSGDVDTWAEWDTDRLIAFLTWHTNVHLPCRKLTIPTDLKKEQPPAPITQSLSSSKITENAEAVSQQLPLENMPTEPARSQLPSMDVSSSPPNQIRLIEWKTLLANTHQPIRNLSHDQAFDVGIMLDLTNIGLPNDSRLNFTIKLFAKKLGSKGQEFVNETQNTFPYSDTVNLTLRNLTLSQGLYRLEALLTVTLADTTLPKKPNLEVIFQGGLLQLC